MFQLLFILDMVLSQRPTCYQIPRDTLCGPIFTNLFLDKPILSFNTNLQTNVINLTQVANSLVSQDVCDTQVSLILPQLRYQLSLQCAVAVYTASLSGCPSNATILRPMCTRECTLALKTQQAVLNNTTYCQKGNTIDVSDFTSYCQNQNNQTNCFSAVGNEALYCGFNDMSTATTQCALPSNRDDQCCQALITNPVSINLAANTFFIVAISVTAGVLFLIALVILYRRRKVAKDEEFNNVSEPSILDIENGTTQDAEITLSKLPEGAKLMRVIHPYTAEMEDELSLGVDDSIFILSSFDDGWCLGFDAKTAKQGAFPLICVENEGSQVVTKRLSSIIAMKEHGGNLSRSSTTVGI